MKIAMSETESSQNRHLWSSKTVVISFRRFRGIYEEENVESLGTQIEKSHSFSDPEKGAFLRDPNFQKNLTP